MSAHTAQTRLYLTVPDLLADTHSVSSDFDELTKQLFTLAEGVDLACVDLTLDGTRLKETNLINDRGKKLVNGLQERGVAVLASLTDPTFKGDDQSPLDSRFDKRFDRHFDRGLDVAIQMGLDGVHILADKEQFTHAKNKLPAGAIIGVFCRDSRHLAMVFGELGADYVALSGPPNETRKTIELVKWWQELFEVPCVAANVQEKGLAETLMNLPADFIQLQPEIWRRKQASDWLSVKCPHSGGAPEAD